MRVIVTKPVNGLFNVRLDDRYGVTGRQTMLTGVTKETLEAALRKPLADWEAVRLAVKEARKRGRA